MPRNGSGVYSKPAGTTAVPNSTIESAKFNQVVDDIAQDLNFARPVSAGGTGGSTAAAARTNLSLYSKSEIDNFLSPLKSAAAGYMSPNYNLTNSSSDPSNSLSFPAGVVASEVSSPILMTSNNVLVSVTAAFGTGTGGRFDSAVSDGWWHCFVISDGTTVAAGYSKSLNPTGQPNYPSGYTYYRRIGSWPRVSGAWASITQSGDTFAYNSAITDRTSPSARPYGAITLSVPRDVPVKPMFYVQQQQGSAGNIQTTFGSRYGDSSTAIVTVASGEVGNFISRGAFETDTLAQINFGILVFSGTLTSHVLVTTGWIDARGRV